jgi:hypothetical protein
MREACGSRAGVVYGPRASDQAHKRKNAESQKQIKTQLTLTTNNKQQQNK